MDSNLTRLEKVVDLYEEYAADSRSVSTSKLRSAVRTAISVLEDSKKTIPIKKEKLLTLNKEWEDTTRTSSSVYWKTVGSIYSKILLDLRLALRDGSRDTLAIALDKFVSNVHGAARGFLGTSFLEEDSEDGWNKVGELIDRLHDLCGGGDFKVSAYDLEE